MDLFLDKYVPTFEKTAAEVELPEDPNRWPHELLQELHKQVSFISDFDPRIVMDRVDAEKGYGFGHFEVGNKMSDPNASPEMRQATGARSARVPIVIQEGRLKPFDLIINEDSKIFPLTETRLRQALFRPNMFDMRAKSPGDEGIIDRLYPPMRQAHGGNSSMTVPGSEGMTVQSAAGMGKTGSDWGKILVNAQIRDQVRKGGRQVERYTGRTQYLRPEPIKKPGMLARLFGKTKTAEEAFNDFVENGESKSPGFEAWDGQQIQTAGVADQRRRARAEGDLEQAIGMGEGAWGQVLSDQNRQAMGMSARGPVAGTNGASNYNQRAAQLHSIAGGHMKQAAKMMKLKGPETDKIIEGQKAEGYKPSYAGSMGPDGKIKKANMLGPNEQVSFTTAIKNIRQMPVHTRNAVMSALMEKKAEGVPARHILAAGGGALGGGVSPLAATLAAPMASLGDGHWGEDVTKRKGQLIGSAVGAAIGSLSGTLGDATFGGHGAPGAASTLGGGLGGGIGSYVGEQFDRGKQASILSSILPTINESDFLRFASACEPEEVKIATLKSTPMAEAVGKLAEWVPQPAVDPGSMAKQDVCQVSKLDNGTYRVKYASSRYWEPRTVTMDRGALYDAIGDVTTHVDLHGSITMVKEGAYSAKALGTSTRELGKKLYKRVGPVGVGLGLAAGGVGLYHGGKQLLDRSKESMPKNHMMALGAAGLGAGALAADTATGGNAKKKINELVMGKKAGLVDSDGPERDNPEPIEDFGMYKVQTTDGQKIVGFAIPNLIDLDGTSLPLVLFTNGSASAVQGDMVGVRSGGEPNLPDGPEQGHGAFVRVRDNGKAEATTPIEIKAEMSDEKGEAWIAEDFNGCPVTIRKQPNIEMPTKVDDVVLLPESFRWMPLSGDSLELVDGVDAFGKQAEAVRHMLSVEVRGGSGAFSIDGPPVEKVAASERHFVDYDGATFLLGGLGVSPEYAMQKLSEANFCERPIRVRIGRTIKTATMRNTEAVKTASATLANRLPLYHREHLVKEASAIPDPTAVDTVLSLGFLNPENILSFINALPNLENAQSRMCEMLLGSRVGLKEVPEGALEKAVRATEDVLEGLKILAFQEM